jgi:hypothetical protein
VRCQKSTSVVFLFALTIAGISYAAVHDPQIDRIDQALYKAAEYLIDKQSPDGAWRSEAYGCFKDGPSLTPYIMSCLFFIPGQPEKVRLSFNKGVQYLVSMVNEDGSINAGLRGLNFPVYTAASASRVVVLQDKTAKNIHAQTAWLSYLCDRRLTGSLGWNPSDPEYGGWGFSLNLPRKPAPGQPKDPMCGSNLTSTVFGIGALRSARVPPEDPIWQDILIFVKKCQNFADDPAESDQRFDDGGFFFCPNDPLQNKAGIAGPDRLGRQRYYSYGSMTADGLRALLACGLSPEHPRVVAARRWLERNFTTKTNPGIFADDREVLRNATYYYYLWSVAHAFSRLGVVEIETQVGRLDWAHALACELIDRQGPDGSWINSFTDAKEDDPLVASAWAAAALANCRQVLAPGDTRSGGTCPAAGIQGKSAKGCLMADEPNSHPK